MKSTMLFDCAVDVFFLIFSYKRKHLSKDNGHLLQGFLLVSCSDHKLEKSLVKPKMDADVHQEQYSASVIPEMDGQSIKCSTVGYL